MRFGAAFVAVLAVSSPALADRPTSGDLTVISGRTMGIDEASLAGAVGWPGIWAEYLVAPSSTFNVGFRGTVLYGSPYLGLGTGVGAQATGVFRFHLQGEDVFDLTLALEPSAVIGEATLVGQGVGFSSEMGYGGGLESTLLGAARVSDVVTLAAGLGGGGAIVGATGYDLSVVGLFHASFAIEALMDRDTMLFGELRLGYGLAPARLFDGHEIVRASLGIAYLL